MVLLGFGFGIYLVFALELMIISDPLHSVVSRALEDLYFLASIVVLRTLIAYFLNKEIQELSVQPFPNNIASPGLDSPCPVSIGARVC